MRCRLLSVPVAACLALAIVGPVHGAPFCQPGEAPTFRLGFALLREQLGPTMGEPVECEHRDLSTGDTLQRTTTGLAYYRRATNTASFTDGYRHWGWTADGVVAWEGAGPDPPGLAELAEPRSPSVISEPTALMSPEALLDALLTTPFEPGELPAGFSAEWVLPGQLPESARVHHAVGAVLVDVRGPDVDNGISYWVFPTATDAAGHFASAPFATFTPAGFTDPARCFFGPLQRAGERYGGTGCVVRVDNVEVLSASILRGALSRGNDEHAVALARAGVAHLERIRARAANKGPAEAMVLPLGR